MDSKISPVEEDVDNLGDDGNASGLTLAQERSKFSIVRKLKKLYNDFTYDNIKEGTRWFLESAAIEFSISFDDIMMLMTLFVLFAGEIRVIAVDKEHDEGFQIMTIICFAFFVFELVMVTWSKTYVRSIYPWISEGYFGTFFFALDVLAIISMFPEIPAISKAFQLDAMAGGGDVKSARVVRMVRLVRIVKLYKIQSERRRAANLEAELLELVRQGAVSYDEIETQRALYQQRQSKVGGLLSDSITRRVIIIVLLMLFGVPLLQSVATNSEREFAVESLHYYNINTAVNDTATRYVAMDAFHKFAPNLLKLEIKPAYRWIFNISTPELTAIGATQSYTNIYLDEKTFKKRREEELLEITESIINNNNEEYSVKATFDLWPEASSINLYQILLTIFVSIMLVMGSVIFTSDAQRLVLDPIERMMNMVEAVAKDPLQPLQFQHDGDGGSGEYETRLLESTIEKITGLLRVGFGEAGAGIIKANLDIADNTAVINPLIPGVRIYAVFGFCDIHHFDEINQCMGQDVLTFVNTIAEIVHSSVHEWGGQSNKNLGNAFLVIWRIGDEKTLLKLTSGKSEQGLTLKDMMNPNKKAMKKIQRVVDLRRVPGIDRLADKALVGYLKIICDINRSKRVLAYRSEPRLTQDGTKEFKVRMGFGLHAGWAIEGAVGSIQKVDATYLSPHVNMAARLETSSKQFGVPLLFSQSLYDLMSPEAQDCCRRLDVVTVKGSEQPIGVFTYDARQEQQFREKKNLPKKTLTVANHQKSNTKNTQVAPTKKRYSVSSGPSKAAAHENVHHSFDYYQHTQESDLQFMTPEHDVTDILELDVDLIYLRRHVTASFYEKHKSATNLYLAGDWQGARILYEECDKIMGEVEGFPGDGPSRVILNYMKNRDYTAPKDWKGYRPLTSK